MVVETLNLTAWHGVFTPALQQQAIAALENGKVVYIPGLAFKLIDQESIFLTPDICSESRKNICYDLNSDCLTGVNQPGEQISTLHKLMQRYALTSRQLLKDLFPQYDQHAMHARTSYRPVEIAGRIPASYRKDDTRLHVDAFPSTPTQGKRILRVFSNVNPNGQARVWRVGEAFANVVNKFAPQVKVPLFGTAALQKMLKITRGYRTLYDHYMLNMHNIMKGDQQYQTHVAQQEVLFPPGSTWFVYTDQVSHAAMAGQYVFEQTFYLPVHGQQQPHTAPLRVLERFLQKSLL